METFCTSTNVMERGEKKPIEARAFEKAIWIWQILSLFMYTHNMTIFRPHTHPKCFYSPPHQVVRGRNFFSFAYSKPRRSALVIMLLCNGLLLYVHEPIPEVIGPPKRWPKQRIHRPSEEKKKKKLETGKEVFKAFSYFYPLSFFLPIVCFPCVLAKGPALCLQALHARARRF